MMATSFVSKVTSKLSQITGHIAEGKLTEVVFSNGRSAAKNFIVGMLMLNLVSFIAYGVLSNVELISLTLTNAAGGGAVALTSMSISSPVKAAQKTFGSASNKISKGFKSYTRRI